MAVKYTKTILMIGAIILIITGIIRIINVYIIKEMPKDVIDKIILGNYASIGWIYMLLGLMLVLLSKNVK